MKTSESDNKTIKDYIIQNQWVEVIDFCKQKLEQDHNRIEFYPYLAKAYTKEGRLTEAIAAYKRTLGTALNQAEIYAELGFLYSKQEDFVQAAWHYQQALKLNPNWPELQYNLAVVFQQLGDWEATIVAYEQALKLKPKYAAVYFNLGVLYDHRGDLETAVGYYQQAIKIQPRHIKAYSNLSTVLAKQNKYQAAIQVIKQGLHLDPTWGTLHNNLGQLFVLNNQPEQALESFEMATCLDSSMGLAYNNLSKLWQQQGNLAEVVKNLKQQLNLEPTNLETYSRLAMISLHQGKPNQAIAYLRQVIALEPSFINAYCVRNNQQESDDLLTKARISCSKFIIALRDEAEDSETIEYLWQTYAHWGDVLFAYGNVKQAETYYRHALDIQAEEVSLYLNLGNCLAKQKRWNAAIAIYEMGLTLEPQHGQICFQLGKILEKQNLSQSALDYYEQILQEKSYQKGVWHELPQLFPTPETQAQLPKAIYQRTIDWVKDCQLDDFSYAEIVWEGTKPNLKLKNKQAPVEIDPQENQKTNHDCGGVSCHLCMTNLINEFQPTFLGNSSYKCSFNSVIEKNSDLPFTVSIPEGRVWSAPQKNSWLVCDSVAVMTPDNYLLGDLSRYYPWFLPGCTSPQKTDHSIFNLEHFPELTQLKGRVAVLSGLTGHVYYHWMFDILPRIELLRLSGIDLNSIDWFVVNYSAKSFQKETLSWLEIPLDKIISSDEVPFIQAEELITPSFPGQLDWVPYGTIKFLRQKFLTKISMDGSKFSKKIYVSRARAQTRHVINEDAVTKFLGTLGFKTVFLEEMSILEQVALFANAEVVVSPHGSGLTNLVFCSPKTKVIELFSPYYTRTDYWVISQHLELEHFYCLGENFNCPPLRNLMYQNAMAEDISVNLNALELILKAAGVSH